MARFANLRPPPQSENEEELAKALNVLLRMTHYDDAEHFKLAVSRCVQRVSARFWPVILGGEPHHISARLGVEIPSTPMDEKPNRKRRRVTEARLQQLKKARAARARVRLEGGGRTAGEK